MSKSKTWAERARTASKLSPEACAAAIGRSRPVYDLREREPGGLTIDQITSLREAYSDDGKLILWEFLAQFRV